MPKEVISNRMLEPIILGIILSAAAVQRFCHLEPASSFQSSVLAPIRERSEHRRESFVSRFSGRRLADHSHSLAQAVPCCVFALNFLWTASITALRFGENSAIVLSASLRASQIYFGFSIPTEYAEETFSVFDHAMPMICQSLGKKPKMAIPAVLTNAFATGECSPSSAAPVIEH